MFNKKSCLMISVILVMMLIFSFTLTGCSGGEKTEAPKEEAKEVKEVKVGFLWPLSGGSSTIGNQHNDGAQMAIEEINKNGGIKSLGGAKIVPVVADTETKPDVGCTQAERLILEEEVCMVVGAYNSAVTFPSSEVAERYETPWVSMGAVKNEITERGFKWVFRVNNKASYDVKEMISAMELFEKETGEKVKTFGMIYESTDWGTDTANLFKGLAGEKGWEIVLDEPCTPGQSDMNSQVLKAKQANPDILFVALYTPDQIVFQKAYAANKLNIKLGLWSGGGGAEDPAFYEAVAPETVEYMFVQDDWDTGGPEKHEWIAELGKQVKEKFGYDMNSFFAQGWTAAYVAYEALEKAGSTDKEAIRKALTELDIQGGRALLTGYQRVKFDENGQNTYSHGTISQRQNNKRVVLWPEANRKEGSKVIWPIPKWEDR